MNPNEFLLYRLAPHNTDSELNALPAIILVAIKHGTLWTIMYSVNCNNFGDPLTFYLLPTSDQNVHFYGQIPFPSASNVLSV